MRVWASHRQPESKRPKSALDSDEKYPAPTSVLTCVLVDEASDQRTQDWAPKPADSGDGERDADLALVEQIVRHSRRVTHARRPKQTWKEKAREHGGEASVSVRKADLDERGSAETCVPEKKRRTR